MWNRTTYHACIVVDIPVLGKVGTTAIRLDFIGLQSISCSIPYFSHTLNMYYNPIANGAIKQILYNTCVIRHSPPGMPYGFVRFFLFLFFFILPPPRFPDDNF